MLKTNCVHEQFKNLVFVSTREKIRLFLRKQIVYPKSINKHYCCSSNGSFPPTETDSDLDPWGGDPSLKWVQ